MKNEPNLYSPIQWRVLVGRILAALVIAALAVLNLWLLWLLLTAFGQLIERL